MNEDIKRKQALELFYQGVMVRDIADKLNCSRGLIYRYIQEERYKNRNPLEEKIKDQPKFDLEEFKRCIEAGYTTNELAKRYNVTSPTVLRWCKTYDLPKPRKPWERTGVESGCNVDRHLCKTCKYRMMDYKLISLEAHCNYIGYMNRSRGCLAADCNKYEKGKPEAVRKKIVL